ncbi:MAG: AI-2E family transporter [Chitinophagaceae bacterium]
MQKLSLSRAIQILFLFFIVFAGLYFAKPFLVSFIIAGILAMLFLPLSRRMEKKGINRGLSAVFCILILLAVISGIIALLTWQIAGLSEDFGKMQEHAGKSIAKLKETISNTFGISPQKQQEMIKEQQSSGAGGAGKVVTAIMGSIMSMLVDTILVFVYIFLLMYLRSHIKQFILKLVPQDEKAKTVKIIDDSSQVGQKYLSGMGMMIVILWIMYGIGFSIVGVKNALFFAMLCGLLEIIPFIGNLAGTALTLIMALSQGGGSNMIIGILITYGCVQFIQTYILEPLVVGAQVKINPLFTIIAIVIGELVWGIPGMILAIPLLGIAKIIFDNIEPLKPYGFLIAEEKKKNDSSFIDKIKGWFK